MIFEEMERRQPRVDVQVAEYTVVSAGHTLCERPDEADSQH